MRWEMHRSCVDCLGILRCMHAVPWTAPRLRNLSTVSDNRPDLYIPGTKPSPVSCLFDAETIALPKVTGCVRMVIQALRRAEDWWLETAFVCASFILLAWLPVHRGQLFSCSSADAMEWHLCGCACVGERHNDLIGRKANGVTIDLLLLICD